jgi:carboxylesterase
MQERVLDDKTSREVTPYVVETANGHGPFDLGSGSRACLLVHGIAGSPAQMRGLGESLAAAGLKAKGFVLPGHGTRPEDLYGIVWQDWYERLHEEYRALRKDHDEVVLIGFSIGAALSAHYAAHNPVDRLILLNIPLYPLNGKYPTNLMLKVYSVFFDKVKGKAEKLIGADGKSFSFVYDWVPTAILHTMTELIDIVKGNLCRIEVPVLTIQARKDKVSGGRSGPFVHNNVGSNEKRLVMLDRDEHSIMVGNDREVVYREIFGFLNGKVSIR